MHAEEEDVEVDLGRLSCATRPTSASDGVRVPPLSTTV
jgi:hypothetical protein